MKKKIGNILPPPADKCNLGFKNFAAFTLAEILLSLTVIGIVAAIALPSLLGNANERAWETQKKALYTRFSQALPLLPSLNGYGTFEGTLSSNSDDGEQHVDTDTAAETFIRDGLSKVMKITNICDSEHLSDCGLPDKIIPINGGNQVELSNIKTLKAFNPIMIKSNYSDSEKYEQLDTKTAAFETVNGESILVYYNPNCEPDLLELYGNKDYFSQSKMCANFVYDLNGKKGPNTVGKDIGFIAAMYSTNPVVVAPNPHNSYYPTRISQSEISAKCKETGANLKAPNIDEATAMFYNIKLLGYHDISSHIWSTNTANGNNAWLQGCSLGRRASYKKTDKYTTWCVKR